MKLKGEGTQTFKFEHSEESLTLCFESNEAGVGMSWRVSTVQMWELFASRLTDPADLTSSACPQ